MFDRSNGARASKSVSARARREAMLRKALLGSTALIGVTLATPALAQSTSPAGGGTISGTGTYSDSTASSGGVTVVGTQSAGITMAGVTIANTTGTPNADGYTQQAANGQSAVLYTTGTNTLSTNQANGSALRMTATNANITWAIGQLDTASVTNLTGVDYGAYFSASGFVNVVDFGTVSSLRNVTATNGVSGIYAIAGSAVNLSLKAPTISGFATGVTALSATGTTVTTTGGTITTLANGTGIYAAASNASAGVTISSGSAITTSGSSGTGIYIPTSNASNNVTTTTGGTINGGSVGIQLNSAQAGQSNTVTVGAAIGNSARPNAGVLFNGVGVIGGINTVNANADILSGNGLYAIGSGWTNTDLAVNVASGVTVSSTGGATIGAGHDITLVNNGTISATNASGTAVRNSQGPSTLTVTNNGTMTAGSVVVSGAATTNVTNSGTITATTNSAIIAGRGGTITNNSSGHITGGSGASGWAVRFDSNVSSGGQVLNNDGQITGGGAGAISIDATTASTLNLNAGSTTTGLIKVAGSGSTSVNLLGSLTGNYDASTATGWQSFTLFSTGSMQGATFGSGADTFTWAGGAFSGTIDGGTGTDMFAVALGSGAYRTVALDTFFANITNFETYRLVSGNLTLSGSRDGGPGWQSLGGSGNTINLTGALTNIADNGITLINAGLVTLSSSAQLSTTGHGIYSLANGNNIQNAGTITAGNGSVSGILVGSGTIGNTGTITYASGGSIANAGYGIYASSNNATITNSGSVTGHWSGVRIGYSTILTNSGLLRGDRFAGIEITAQLASTITNNSGGRIYGATGEGSGIQINGGAVTVTNNSGAQIVGTGNAGIWNQGSGLLTVVNGGTIATGTLDGSNNYVAGGITTGIRSGSANITNSGLIEGQSGGIITSGALTLTNTGTINGRGTGNLNFDGVNVGGVSTILNAGTISQSAYAAIYAGGGGTITNAAAGTLTGGNAGPGGVAVVLGSGGTFNNYGTANSGSGNGVAVGNIAATINLFAASTTGNVTGGSGNDTLAIYNGGIAGDAAIIDAGSGITLRNAGALAAATFGTVDLGTGNDTLQLRGTGSGSSFSIATSTGAETLTKLDAGTWTLTGAAITPGIRIDAGTGTSAGTLVFNGTTGLTGTIYVNGATIRANTVGAFGTGAIHMVDPTVQFGAAGTYANNFLLDVAAPASADPTIFDNQSGGLVTLSGNITTGTGNNVNGQAIAAAQDVTFTGSAGSAFTVSGANNWSGATTINTVSLTVSGGAAIGDASAVTVNGGANLVLASSETVGSLAGAGNVQIGANTLTLGGNNASTTFSGAITDPGGVAFVGSWNISAGPSFTTNPPTYTAQEAAALLFGGNAGDYRISTAGSSAGAINDLAWYNIYGQSTVQAAANYRVDGGSAGYNAVGDTSAYVGDHIGSLMNYAFGLGSAGGTLTKTGTGTLTLSGANTYSGTTTISGGTLALGGTGTLASTPIVNNTAFDISGHTGAASILNLTGTGTTTLGANTLNITAANGTYSGAISGTGALSVSGGALYTLTGFNSYTGGTTITGAGTRLQVGNGTGSGRITGTATVDSGATLIFSRNDNYDMTVAVNGAGTVQALGTVSLSGAITNSGALNVNSATGGTVTLTGARSGAGTSAVTVAGAGNTLRVGLTGSVAGGQQLGVYLDGIGNGVDNFGSITNTGTGGQANWGAAIGVAATSGTSVINNGSASNSSATISGQNSGINHLGSGGVTATGLLTVNNYGLITGSAYNAIENQGGSGALTVTNYASGRIVGPGNSGGGNAIGMGGTGTLTLTNAGQIVGRTNGIATASTVNITNSGTIASGTLSGGTSGTLTVGSGSGVTAAGGSVTNQSGGLITGTYAISSNAALTLANAGTLTGTTNGVYLTTGGSLTVTSNTGTITSGTGLFGAIYSAGNVTLQNYAGTTTGNAWGVLTQGVLNATITGGTITGTNRNALYSGGANSTITNAGTLIGGNAAIYADGANLSVTNTGTIRITGGSANTIVSGIYASAAGAQVTNSGTIESTLASGRGVYLLAGGTVTNQAGGTINGGIEGIRADGAVTITNNGTISGTTAAINLTGTFNDTITLNAGSTTTGAINLGAGNDTLNWNGGTFAGIDAGAGTDVFNVSLAAPATLGLANVTGFETQNLLGGTLTLTGTQTGEPGWTLSAGTTLNIGAAGQAANLAITGTGATVGGAGTRVNIASGSTLSASIWGVTGSADSIRVYNDGTMRATGIGAALNLLGTNAYLENHGAITAVNSAANYSVVWMNGAGATALNSGTITGATAAGNYNAAVGMTGAGSRFENQGTGSVVTGQRGVLLGTNATVVNNGTINATVDNGISVGAGSTVSNSGTINANGTVDAWGVFAQGGATITNTGSINGGSGLWLQGAGATYTVTNAGTITGGSSATTSWGVNVVDGNATITSSGTITGLGAGAMALGGTGTINVNLQAGSTTTGNIVSTGAGVRNLEIAGAFNGIYDASAGTGVDHITLRAGGVLGAAGTPAGTIVANLGDGDDLFTYYGGAINGIVSGGAGYDRLDADLGVGQSYNVTLANFTDFEAFGLVSGDLTITGTGAGSDADIYAGNGSPAGTVTFTDTANLTGDIYVNGATIRATTAGGFGSGTIHMIDPTAIFGATGTYANNISLEVVTPSSADPATLNADAGVIATLTGAITTSGNAGVDPAQQLVIGGQGTIVLANAANSWTGATTINAGATLQGASDTISGSAIVNNGVLAYQQSASGTVSQDISGTGNVRVGGLAAGNALTFAGTNSFIGSIFVQDASNVAISGSTNTGTAIGVALGNGASRLDVTATGSLTTSNTAVSGSGANQVVNNFGTIASTGDAVLMSGANALLDNSGTITGGRGFSSNSANAQLVNHAGATITGNVYDAVYLANGGTVVNSGTIQSLDTYTGIYVAGAAGTITNNAGGSITSQGTGVWLDSTGSSIVNLGTVSAATNAAIYVSAAGTVTNSGTIIGGSTGYGVSANAASTITNQAGGTINGGLGALYLDGSSLITVNLDAGSTTTGLIGSNGTGNRVVNIFGTLNGSYAGGAGVDAITLDTGATLAGMLDGGAGIDTLALTGTGSATLGAVFNIENATKSGTGTWTLGTANDVAAWAITGGTLVTGGAMSTGASVDVATGGTLQLTGNQGIGALSGNGTVALGANTLGLLSGTSSFGGALTGTGNLLIDGANLTFGGTAGHTGLTEVRTGSLTLAAGARFDPASTLLVGTAGTLDLGTTDATVSVATLRGTLNGTGTLTATQYALIGATVNGNLGTGTVYSSGATALNGTAAGNVVLNGGTLTLGAANRLADTATVQVDTGATLNLGAFNDTIGVLALGGTLAGTGTLTAGQYELTAATVNANLGTGTVYNLSGTSTLNGTAAGNVSVQAGTLSLGAANRLADTATVTVASGATLNIGAFNDTVGVLGLNGTLAGTGTLTASQYELTAATVNANLGTGTVYNLSGTSTLNGTAAGDVSVQGGTLALGASDRLADTATVTIASGATLNIGAFNDTVGVLGLSGTLAGTGTLTAGQYQLTGATVNANLGAGTLFNLSGTSTLNGTATGNVSVQGGTLALGASDRFSDTATVAVASGATLNIGAFNDTVGVLGLSGTLAGTGTLTAGQYQLTGATVNANLGAGTLFNLSGTSTLNGTVAGDVSVQSGTLRLGAANRLADTATVMTAAGSTLDIGTFNDTIGALALGGTLAGTGTLSAVQVQLNAATVNANLGAGTLTNMTGTSVLGGTAAATTVTVQGGTLRLGASDRLADTATLGVASGATFDLATYNETVAALAGTGTVALGTGRLTLNTASNSGFGGSITGSGSIDKQGIGTLTLAGTFATTGRFDVSAGTLAFTGSTQGGIRVQGGTLIGGGTLAGALTVNSGTFSPGGLATGALGAINPIGSFTVGSLVATGGTLLFDFGGTSLNFASDSIKVNGTATLSGGTVQVNALTAAASDYRFNQLYTIVQANALTGTFANGSVFATVASNPNLKWRLRYDLVANAVVLQVQKNMEFSDGVAAGDTNTLAVANALSNSTTGNASDSWAATLNSITALSTQQRVAAFKSFSGEILADASTSTIAANNLFTDLLRQRVGDGSDALVGGGFAGSSLADIRSTTTQGNSFASALSGATLPGTDGGDAGKGGVWGQVYGGYQKLLGDGVHAGLETTTAGVAMGVETRMDGFTAGIAGGVAQIDSDMDSRNSTVSGNQYQLGGYVSYDTGTAFVAASGSWYSSDLDSKRTLSVGSTTSLATGDIHADGYSVGVTAGFRAELGNGLRLALIGSAAKVRNQQDGFTENAAGGLGLQMASANRDLFTAGGELRLGAKVKTGSGTAMPWVSMGVRYNSGDLDTAGTVRFSGAPAGTGSFGVQGVRIAPVLGTLGVGIDARASKNVRLGIALEGSAGENTREGRASVRVKIGF